MNDYKRLIYTSPQASKRSGSIINDEIVCLINTLNASIKSYYNSAKLTLTQIKDCLTITQQPKIEAIETVLISFIKDAKEIFKKLKVVHNKSKGDHDPFYDSTRSPPLRRSLKPLSPGQYLLVSSPYYNRVNIFSESNQNHTHQTTKQITNIYNSNNNTISNNANHHQVLSLAHGVINFLTQIMQFEDSVMKKRDDVKEKKKQFEVIKNKLLLLAKGILDSSRQYYSSQDSKKSSNGNSSSKDREKDKDIKTISGNINKQEDVQLNNNNTNRQKTNGKLNPLFVNKMKNTIQMLQKKNKDLIQKINELNEMLTLNSGSTTLTSKLKGCEIEIKKLKELNLKGSFDKSKSTDDKLKAKDAKIKALTNNIKEYELLIDQKEKIIFVLKQLSNKIMIEKKNKSSELNHYKERILGSDSNGLTSTLNNYSPPYSHIRDDCSDKLTKRVQELTNELIMKSKELEKLKEEDSQKDAEITYCARELNEIKEIFETENNKLKDELKYMEKDNKLLSDELKLLNDQISKIIKSGNQSPHDHHLVILAKNTIEYKKMHDDLFKERKEKSELINNKKLLKQEISKLTNELLKKNKEIEILSKEVIQLEDKLKQYNPNYSLEPIEEENCKNSSMELQSKTKEKETIRTNLNKRPSQDILIDNCFSETNSKKTTQIEISLSQSNEIREKMIKLQSENIALAKTMDTLNEKLIDKEKTIAQLRDQIDSSHNSVSKELTKKNEDINSLKKKIKELNESYEISKNVIREKESTISDLNNKANKIAENEKMLEVEKAKVIEYYENKLKELSLSPIEIKDEGIKALNEYKQLQNDLKCLRLNYEAKCEIITNKNNQIDVISTQNLIYENEIMSLKEKIKETKAEIELLNNKISSQAKEFLNQQHQQGNKDIISYETHRIICDKTYNNLHWYLINFNNNQQVNYSNTYWIESNRLSQDQLIHFNKFKTEREIEEEALSYISLIQAQLIKKLEDKDNEVMKMQQENNQLNEKITNTNITRDISKDKKNNTLELNPLSPRINTIQSDDCYIPIEKYNKVIMELNELNNKLNKANTFANKLMNENKELSKIQDESKVAKIDQGLSFINTEKEMHSFFDDELKDVINIPECKPGQGIEGIFNEIRTLVQILIHEMNYTSKIRKILMEICKLIGFSEENTIQMVNEKEKKGGILNMFKKK